MDKKFQNLQKYLKTLDRQGICLAFSGGVDSVLLLYLIKDLNSAAVTFKSEIQTDEEIDFARNFCAKIGVSHTVIEISALDNPKINHNPKNRCYHCKYTLFSKLKDFALQNNFGHIIDGTNFDDLGVYRPGLKALEELQIISPFVKFEITKPEIREFARQLGLEIFNKPSSPCIATRFPYDTDLSENDIIMVKSAEKTLKECGFAACRVRKHNNIARIEIPIVEFTKFLNKRTKILTSLKTLGFSYVTLDISGLQSGSMDI